MQGGQRHQLFSVTATRGGVQSQALYRFLQTQRTELERALIVYAPPPSARNSLNFNPHSDLFLGAAIVDLKRQC